MPIPQTSLDDPKKIQVPEEPKKKPKAQKPEKEQEPTVIKIVYVYVPVPQEYIDDPYLTVKQVMVITGFGKQKSNDLVRDKLKHYWDGAAGSKRGNLRTRKSWLQKWMDDHTEDPISKE